MSTKASTTTIVGLCAGKDCRRSREFGEMQGALARCTVVETKCLDICDGPVVILDPLSDDAIVLSKLRSSKDVRDVQRLANGEAKLSARLEKRRVLGSKRRSALRRAARTLRR
ncbi:MAG: hypothetical protein ABWZ99_05825 [Ilumatobacteraceae bacterium]